MCNEQHVEDAQKDKQMSELCGPHASTVTAATVEPLET